MSQPDAVEQGYHEILSDLEELLLLRLPGPVNPVEVISRPSRLWSRSSRHIWAAVACSPSPSAPPKAEATTVPFTHGRRPGQTVATVRTVQAEPADPREVVFFQREVEQ